MTWSVSQSGKKEDVASAVKESCASQGHAKVGEVLAVLVGEMGGNRVSISGSGHSSSSGGQASVSLSGWTQSEEPTPV